MRIPAPTSEAKKSAESAALMHASRADRWVRIEAGLAGKAEAEGERRAMAGRKGKNVAAESAA